ncbi:MAG: exodeoxyribonuclease VII large subunit [Bacteroidales bacterium]|nr:exodeoxyribonuclease VII large subunit [Bacteroidales bacterium]
MPTFNDKPVYTLTQVGQSIQSMIERTYKYPYYIQAEMVRLNRYPRTGHCFPELVEKEGNRIKAQMRAVIWNNNFDRINDNFERITGEPLKDGITILCLATIQFSPQYGLALYIQDIEPSYTLGEMARNRQKTIARLKAEGIFDANKRLKMPLLPQRIAVISIETSKGYSDFMVTLQGDKHHYLFETELFPSLLQGEKAVTTMTEQLNQIEKRVGEFDCVAIIRGGGGDVGLSCYDDYTLARRVATFPLPILSGIGHSTNETITDNVSFANKITPTEAACYLINRFVDFENRVNELKEMLLKAARLLLERENLIINKSESDLKLTTQKLISRESQRLVEIKTDLKIAGKNIIETHKRNLDSFSAALQRETSNRLSTEKFALDKFQSDIYIYSKQQLAHETAAIMHLEEKLQLLNPSNILRRGFSITYHNGVAVTNAAALKTGDSLKTVFYEGETLSSVNAG